MKIALDMRSLLIMASIINLIAAISFWYIYKTRRTYTGFYYWILSPICGFWGMLFIGLRNIIPDFFGVFLANICIVLHALFITYGLDLFVKKRLGKLFYYIPFGLTVGGMIDSTYINPNINIRIIGVSLIITYYLILGIYVLYTGYGDFFGKEHFFMEAMLIITVIFYFLRCVLTFYIEGPIKSFLNPSIIQSTTVLVFISMEILYSFGLLILNAQRVEYDINIKMEEIKRLRGIIPICAGCKKIRDDKGYWNQIELYLKEHADIKFSRALCPACTKKFSKN